MNEELRYIKTYKDGRVLALNVWRTGAQQLVYHDKAAFDRAHEEVTKQGKVPNVIGYTCV